VDDDVDAAEGRGGLGEQPLHIQIVINVCADRHGSALAGQNRFDGRGRGYVCSASPARKCSA
jgi:hypothetical protein